MKENMILYIQAQDLLVDRIIMQEFKDYAGTQSFSLKPFLKRLVLTQ